MQKATILIVESDQAICELYRDLFHEAGYRTKMMLPDATSAEYVGEVEADVVLLDVAPCAPLASLGLIQQLRACPQTADIPVVLLSTAPGLFDDLPAPPEQLGCTALPKPFQVDELLACVDAALPWRRARLAARRQQDGRSIAGCSVPTSAG
jgi:DNA-binding response OmpR family regulator